MRRTGMAALDASVWPDGLSLVPPAYTTQGPRDRLAETQLSALATGTCVVAKVVTGPAQIVAVVGSIGVARGVFHGVSVHRMSSGVKRGFFTRPVKMAPTVKMGSTGAESLFPTRVGSRNTTTDHHSHRPGGSIGPSFPLRMRKSKAFAAPELPIPCHALPCALRPPLPPSAALPCRCAPLRLALARRVLLIRGRPLGRVV